MRFLRHRAGKRPGRPYSRINSWMQKLIRDNPRESILIVSHAGSNKGPGSGGLMGVALRVTGD